MNRGRLSDSPHMNGSHVHVRSDLCSSRTTSGFVRPRSPLPPAGVAQFYPHHSSTPKQQTREMSSSSGQELPEYLRISASSPGNNQRHKFGGRRGNWRRSSVGCGGNSTSTPTSSHGDANHGGVCRFRNSIEKQERKKPYNLQKKTIGNLDCTNDMSLYFHPSMLEDPWAELELGLKKHSWNQKSSSHESFSTPLLDSNQELQKVKEASASPSGSTASDIEIADSHGLNSPFTSEKDTVTSGSDG